MDLVDLRASFAGRLIEGAEAMAPFLTDWRRKWTGVAFAVAQPETPEAVASVVRWCRANHVALVPQGGNTGLSGGATPDMGGRSLVLSTTRLQRIRMLDHVGQTVTAEAGVTLQQVQDAARESGRLFPLSLAAQGSCTIGGNLASNAGGVQVLRYGNARELCLGLEVVTAEGEVWDGLRPLRKDNSGYALRDLFIGSEGTLGVITAAVLKLFPLPKAQVTAFVAVPSPAAALALLQMAQQHLAAQGHQRHAGQQQRADRRQQPAQLAHGLWAAAAASNCRISSSNMRARPCASWGSSTVVGSDKAMPSCPSCAASQRAARPSW